MDTAIPEDVQRDRARARDVVAELVKSRPDRERAERRESQLLFLEWTAIVAVTYALTYAVRPWPLKVALLVPWSIVASLTLDNIIHYLNHWPLRRPWAQRAWRIANVFVFANPLQIRYVHDEHHAEYLTLAAEPTFPAGLTGLGVVRWALTEALWGLAFLVPWRALPDEVLRRAPGRRGHVAEIRLVRWLMPVWFGFLVWLDWQSTVFALLPALVVVGSLASFVMNVTDHAPGDPTNPFQAATYFVPRTRFERFLCAANHHTAATHLTHHLFPEVHGAHLAAVTAELEPIYRAQRAPTSLLIGTVLLGNPIGLLLTLASAWRASRDFAPARVLSEVPS